MGSGKDYIYGTGHMTKMATILIYGKNLQKSNRPRYQVSVYRTIGPLVIPEDNDVVFKSVIAFSESTIKLNQKHFNTFKENLHTFKSILHKERCKTPNGTLLVLLSILHKMYLYCRMEHRERASHIDER